MVFAIFIVCSFIWPTTLALVKEISIQPIPTFYDTTTNTGKNNDRSSISSSTNEIIQEDIQTPMNNNSTILELIQEEFSLPISNQSELINDDYVDPTSASDFTGRENNWKNNTQSNQSVDLNQVYWHKNSYHVIATTTAAPLVTQSNKVHHTCLNASNNSGKCPPFRILERRKLYEIRHYPYYKWASTIVMGENRFLAQWEALARLQEYFDGHNEQGDIHKIIFIFRSSN